MLNRFPSFDKILPVYAVVAFMAYGWNLIHFFWKIPSWLLFLTLGDIFGVLAYALTAALLESLVILAAVLAICFLLPARFFKNDFIVRSTWLVIVGYGAIMVMLSLNSAHGDWMARHWNLLSAVSAILAGLSAHLSTRAVFLRSAALWISDQLIVFLLILTPASLVSILAVVIRNIN